MLTLKNIHKGSLEKYMSEKKKVLNSFEGRLSVMLRVLIYKALVNEGLSHSSLPCVK